VDRPGEKLCLKNTASSHGRVAKKKKKTRQKTSFTDWPPSLLKKADIFSGKKASRGKGAHATAKGRFPPLSELKGGVVKRKKTNIPVMGRVIGRHSGERRGKRRARTVFVAGQEIKGKSLKSGKQGRSANSLSVLTCRRFKRLKERETSRDCPKGSKSLHLASPDRPILLLCSWKSEEGGKDRDRTIG